MGFAPFFLFDRRDTLYSLVQWRGTAIIGGNSIWTIFARTPLDGIARRLDFYAVVLFVVIITFLAARRFNITAYSRDAWAVLALASLAVPLLSKTNWPYYYLEPFIFLLIWEFSSMHDRRAGLWRWPVLAISFLAVTATLSQYIYLPSVGAGDRILVGLLEFAAMGTFVVLVWVRLGAAKPQVAPNPASYPAPSLATTPWTPPAGSPALPRMPEPSRPPDWLPGVIGGPVAPDYRPRSDAPALPPLDNPLRRSARVTGPTAGWMGAGPLMASQSPSQSQYLRRSNGRFLAGAIRTEWQRCAGWRSSRSSWRGFSSRSGPSRRWEASRNRARRSSPSGPGCSRLRA